MDKYTVLVPAGQKAIGQLKIKRLLESLDDSKAWDVTITPHRVRRSLDANAYAWVLIDQIASQLHESKEKIYQDYTKNVGGNCVYMAVKPEALDMTKRIWSQRGLGWGVNVIGDNGEYIEIEMYYGSSAFDTVQMSRLIDLIVQDCMALGIPTKDPEELEALVKEWGV